MSEVVDNSGLLFLVTAPSGAGKTSLVRAWSLQDPRLSISISHTTRPPRVGEVPGQHYHFVDNEAFAKGVDEGLFLEHAKVFQHHYGTTKEAVMAVLERGEDIVLEIDWQGAMQIKTWQPDAVWVLVVPPDVATLAARLKGRNQDSLDVIQTRMEQALGEMQHYEASDYIVVNDVFEQALASLVSIANAERQRTSRPMLRKKMEKLLSMG